MGRGRQRRGDLPRVLAHVAVAHLAAVPAHQRQQHQAERAQQCQPEYARADQLRVAAHGVLLLVRLRAHHAGTGSRDAAGRLVVPADLRVSDRQIFGLALLVLRDEARVGQRVVGPLVARAGGHVEPGAGEAVAGTRGHGQVRRPGVHGAGEGERAQVRGVQPRRQHRARADGGHEQPAAVTGVGRVAGHLRQLQVRAARRGPGVGDARARARRRGLRGQRLRAEGRGVPHVRAAAGARGRAFAGVAAGVDCHRRGGVRRRAGRTGGAGRAVDRQRRHDRTGGQHRGGGRRGRADQRRQRGDDAGGGRERGYRGEQATPHGARFAVGTRHGTRRLPDRGRWNSGVRRTETGAAGVDVSVFASKRAL